MYMLGKISSDTSAIKDHLGRLNGRVQEHEKRIDDLYDWRSGLMGKVWGVGTVVGLFWTVINYYK